MIDQPKEYSVAKGEGPGMSQAVAELERNVLRMLEMGWHPQGGISTGSFTSGFVWATQAMCRYWQAVK